MSGSKAAVFFDRDNTLIVTDGYLGDPAAVVLLDGAADAVARARRLGYSTVVFSNQSGVARGLFEEDAVHAVNAQMEEHLRMSHPEALIDRHEYCPFHPTAPVERYRLDTPMRKPAPGMLYHAADELGLDLSQSWVVGDAPRDIEAGQAAGCRTIWLRHDLPPSAAARASLAKPADFEVKSLTEALDVIERHPQSAATDNTSQQEIPSPALDRAPGQPAEPDNTSTAAAAPATDAPTAAVEAEADQSKTATVADPQEWAPPTSAATAESERTAEWVFVAEGGGEGAADEAAAPTRPLEVDNESPAWPAETPATADEAEEADDSSPVGLTFPSQGVSADEPSTVGWTPIAEPAEGEPSHPGAEPSPTSPPPAPEPEPVIARSAPAPEAPAVATGDDRPAFGTDRAEAPAPADPPRPAANVEKHVPMVSEAARLAMREAAAAKKAARRTAAQNPDETSAAPAPAQVNKKEVAAASQPAPAQTPRSGDRVENLAEQILTELRRRHEQRPTDFSVTKLLAGIVQIMVLPALFAAYLAWGTPAAEPRLLLALVLQAMTIALLMMSRL